MLEYILIFLIIALLSYVVPWMVDTIYYIPSVFMRGKKFRCMRCGNCCRKIVPIGEDDIRRIEKHGHDRKYFVKGFGPFKTLRRKNGRCVFLAFSGNKAVCSIYPYRAGICRGFPIKKIWGVELVSYKCRFLRR